MTEVYGVGEPGDPQDNPTLAWPKTRKHFTARTLTITQATPQQKGIACEPINFDPLTMADGIAPTNDPVLLFRSPAYAVSYAKRPEPALRAFIDRLLDQDETSSR